ncbi:MAG: aromatic amino acid ammonia-lyase [bacterium]|nr:aromatic amino acid ammonia-lyase [bacterium]
MKTITIGEGALNLKQVGAAARGQARVAVSTRSGFLARMRRSREVLDQALRKGIPVYGVSTGYGSCCGNQISPAQRSNMEKLGENLMQYHGCGVGQPLDREEVRAAMVCRMACLARGYSGVTVNLLNQTGRFLNRDITPVVPSLGSVGASGDLTPMSYIARALAGEGEVLYRGRVIPARKALALAGIKKYRFQLKEPLAFINGTSMMTGIAVVALGRARNILEAAIAGTALAVQALQGHSEHFHPVIAGSKPHPGQIIVAEKLRKLLGANGTPPPESKNPSDLQDPYSLRCAPQILGVVSDALEWIEEWITNEINSANDNPLLDWERKEVLMGGNFYGGHVAFAMDALKSALAAAADLLERQLALLVDPRFSRGLPANLVKISGGMARVNHGFKAMQITASALTAEALKNTLPAASFSRSTESHNQDKVSMGTISARDAARQCYLVSRVASIQLLAAVQACELRGGLKARPRLAALAGAVRSRVKANGQDHPMDREIEILAESLPEMDFLRQ